MWFSSVSPTRAVTCLNWARPVAVCFALVIVLSGTARSGRLEMTLNDPRTEREVNHSILHSHFQSVSHSPTRHSSSLSTTPSLARTHTYNLNGRVDTFYQLENKCDRAWQGRSLNRRSGLPTRSFRTVLFFLCYLVTGYPGCR